MVSDARPIKDNLFTKSIVELIGGHGKRAVHLPVWYVALLMASILQFLGEKSEEKTSLTPSDISAFVFETFALVLTYAWHVEVLNDIDEVHNSIYRIENKIDSLIETFYTFQRQLQKSPDDEDYQYHYDSFNADLD